MQSRTGAVRPADDSYWVVPGRFLAGEYPVDLTFLRGIGISVFIDLTEEQELRPYSQRLEGAVHERFPIPAVGVPATRELTTSVLDAIDEHLSQGRTVYLHCMGGIGRTGTIVGCWLARHGHPGQGALDRLRGLRGTARIPSPVTPEQVRYVLGWEEVG